MTPLLSGDCEEANGLDQKLGISLERPKNWVEFSLSDQRLREVAMMLYANL